MTDTKNLKIAIMRADISHEEIAYKLGITRETLWRKINNITEFKAREIMLLRDILQLSNEQRDAIFFSEKGDK
uniref:HTH domain-containing protein n=1 Tax=uncultured Allisonella sp. TaxID=339338 RepID=UPI0025937BD6|nr:HTH domain-containing protein [uncultured Allisonella sp.]